ncbi:MAG: flagellar biosynthetic protein FliR [Gammaproteobacteria bacterium]|nr:flagellar biosynthetic protein FliR [Gammaproteobacteria bacterium]MCP5202280.1 flagellar biosynthetic protein FliR [Gammaproteobacteria bacterium]
MHFTEAQLLQGMMAWLWPFLRVGGFVMAAPVIGTRAVPTRIRVVLALLLTSVLAPLAAAPAIDPLSASGLLTAAQQVVVGATIGLVLRLTFFVFEFAGQLVSQQTGLGFASLVDPTSGAQVPVLAHFYIVLATLLFFTVDAHLVLVQLLADSFRLLPIGPVGIAAAGAEGIVSWTGELIADGLLLGLPVIVALLAINFALGVMARAAPQLNIFAVGFPLMILFGMVLVVLTLEGFDEAAIGLFDSGIVAAHAVLEAR